MKKTQSFHFTLIGAAILFIFSFSSCKKLFNPDDEPKCGDAEMKLPEIEDGAIFRWNSDLNGLIAPKDIPEFYPGYSEGGGYTGAIERDLRYMQVRWTFEEEGLFSDPETGQPYPKELVEQMPSYKMSFGKSFTKDLPDDQIGTGDILMSYQAVIFNKCGESNPITGQIKLINSGNVLQGLNKISARFGHIQAYHNNKLYLLFGRGGDENYSYDVATKVLTPLPPIDFSQFGYDLNNSDTKVGLQRALYGDSQGYGPFITYAQKGSKVYFAISREASHLVDILWEYDLETLTLSKLASIDLGKYSNISTANPTVVGFPSAGKMTLVDNKIYYFPLYLYSDGSKAYIGVFDLNTKQWNYDEHIAIAWRDLVPPINYVGSFVHSVRNYFQLFYAIDNQLKLVFEGNREVTYNLASKQTSVKETDYKYNGYYAGAANGLVYDGVYYFTANDRVGQTIGPYYWYKKKKNGTVERVFTEMGSDYAAGVQFTPVEKNSLIFIGGGATRYWFER